MRPSVIAITAIIVLWIASIQRKLSMLDENVNNAMNQIGVQLSKRFDALVNLLDLIKDYSRHESEMLFETIKSRRYTITENSSTDDVLGQEKVISEALSSIATITERYPELRESKTYIKTMDAFETYEKMLCNSLSIYNKSVAKLNREIHTFPISVIASILGFKKRIYLEE